MKLYHRETGEPVEACRVSPTAVGDIARMTGLMVSLDRDEKHVVVEASVQMLVPMGDWIVSNPSGLRALSDHDKNADYVE